MSFVFSYNHSDPDLPSTSSYASTSQLHDQLTAVVPPLPAHHAYHAGLGADAEKQRSRFDGDDDFVPAYGPTTSRRGAMRFVPATLSGLGTLPGTGKTQDIREKGKGRAVELEEEDVKQDKEEQEEEKEDSLPPPPPPRRLPGPSVRGLYESIVGVKQKQQQSAPASLRASPAPPPPLFRLALSEPPDRAVSVDVKREDDDDVLILSSDDEDEAAPPPPKKRTANRPPPPAEKEDDDLIILDPITGLQLPALSPSIPTNTSPSPPPPPASFSYNPPPPSSRVRPLLIHQLLPSTATPAVNLPTQYAIKPDNPGWRMLQKQGWREGAALGPDGGALLPNLPPAPLAPYSLSAAAAPPREPAPTQSPRGLLVPLRPTLKHDRLGLGSAGTTKEALRRLTPAERERERLKRELEEKREREKRGKGERGMERVRKREERERKAWIAYMNR
ncbi:hypothetical protein JCM11251_006355 [Rhodosporidiobolus azoricus]